MVRLFPARLSPTSIPVTLREVCGILASSQLTRPTEDKVKLGAWVDLCSNGIHLTYFRDIVGDEADRAIESFRVDSIQIRGQRLSLMLDVMLVDNVTTHISFGPLHFGPSEITEETHQEIARCMIAIRAAYCEAGGSLN